MSHGREITFQPNAAERRLEHLLIEVDRRITITDPEYEVAKERIEALSSALSQGFRSRVYVNGSIEHGDALSPLSDIDLGVILGEPWATNERHRSPTEVMKHACEIIEDSTTSRYPRLSVDFTDQKRAVVVRFGSTARDRLYRFTADVIVALDFGEGAGVLIPNLQRDEWDRSDPIRHSAMIRQANVATHSSFNSVVRIAKQWNRVVGQPLSSWNIKALALSSIVRPVSLLEGVYIFFRHAGESLRSGLTPDPAGIGSPIGLEMKKSDVLARLDDACEILDRVVADAMSGNFPRSRQAIESLFLPPSVRMIS